MRQAIIYARVSTNDKQDFNRQIDDLTALVSRHGYKSKSIKVFAESVSGYKSANARPKLQQVLELVEGSPNDYIIYTSEISRIGRNPTETRRIIDRLTDIGVPVYIESLGQSTIDGTGKRNMIMNIILQVLIEYANLEAETFKLRSKSGLLKSAKAGKAGGSLNMPYGYEKDKDGYLVTNSEEVPVVQEIFRLYQSGNGIKVIAGILNHRKVKTRMNKTHAGKMVKHATFRKDGSTIQWSDKQVHDILKNTLYKGERRFKGHVIPAPAVVTTELWDECATIMQSKTHRNYLTNYTYLLKDLCECGTCGRNYFAKYKPVDGGDKVYICSSRLQKGGNCGNVGVNITLIESAIYEVMLNSKTIWKHLNNEDGLKDKMESDISSLSGESDKIGKAIDGKRKEKDRLLDLYLSGKINEALFTKKDAEFESTLVSLQTKLNNITKALLEKNKALKSFGKVKTTRQMMLNAKNDREQLRAMIQQVIGKVSIYPYESNIVVVSLQFQTGGQHLGYGYLALDLNGTRKKNQSFRYMNLMATLGEKDWVEYAMEQNFDEMEWKKIEESNLIVL